MGPNKYILQMILGPLFILLWLALLTSVTLANWQPPHPNTIYGSYFERQKQIHPITGLITIDQDLSACDTILLSTTIINILEHLGTTQGHNPLTSPRVKTEIQDLTSLYHLPPHMFVPGLHNLIQILTDPTIGVVQSIYTSPQHLISYRNSSQNILRHIAVTTPQPESDWLMPSGLKSLENEALNVSSFYDQPVNFGYGALVRYRPTNTNSSRSIPSVNSTSSPTTESHNETSHVQSADNSTDQENATPVSVTTTDTTTTTTLTKKRRSVSNGLFSMLQNRKRRDVYRNRLLQKVRNSIHNKFSKLNQIVRIFNNNGKLIHDASNFFKTKTQKLTLTSQAFTDYSKEALTHIKRFVNKLRLNTSSPHTLEEALTKFFNNSDEMNTLGSILSNGLDQLTGIVKRKALTYLPRRLLTNFSDKLSHYIKNQTAAGKIQKPSVSLDLTDMSYDQLKNIPYSISLDTKRLTHKISYHLPLTSPHSYTSHRYVDGPIQHLYKNRLFDIDYDPYCQIFLDHSDTPEKSRTVVDQQDIDEQCLHIDKQYCLMERIPDNKDKCLAHLYRDQPSYEFCSGRIIPVNQSLPLHVGPNVYQYFTNETMTIVLICTDSSGDRVIQQPAHSLVTITLNTTCSRAHTLGFSFTYNPDDVAEHVGVDQIQGTSLVKPLIPYFLYLIKKNLPSFDLHDPIVLTWLDKNLDVIIIVSSASVPILILFSCIGYCLAKRAKCNSRRCNSIRLDTRTTMRTRQTKKDSDTDSEFMQLEQLCPPGYSCP